MCIYAHQVAQQTHPEYIWSFLCASSPLGNMRDRDGHPPPRHRTLYRLFKLLRTRSYVNIRSAPPRGS